MTSPAEPGGVRSSPVLKGAIRATAILAAAGMIGQVFTLVREVFVASQVGVSTELDALLVAQVAPLILASLLSSGISAAIVPAYLIAEEERGKDVADRLLGATLTWMAILSVVATAMVIAAASLAVTIAGPGLDPAARTLAIGYVPILAPSLIFLAIGPVLAATFQIRDQMRIIGLAWLVGPLVSVITTILLWPTLGLTALAIAITGQQFAIVVVLLALGIGTRMLPRPSLRADRVEARRLVGHALPLAISSSALMFNLLADRAIATLIVPGGVSALRYAEGVIKIPLNAIGPAWSAAIYPALVRASRHGGAGSMGEAASGALRYVTVIFVPLSVATAALAPLIVAVAYGRGAFDQEASALTAAALVGFAPLLFLTMANSILTGSHNARRRGTFLMSMGILSAILNAVFDIGFGSVIGVAGIALATSSSVAVVQYIKARRLGSIDESFPLASVLRVSVRSLAASLIVAVPIGLVAWSLPHGGAFGASLLTLIALASAGMVGYVVVSRLIGLHEPWLVAKAMLQSPGRLRSAGGR